MIRKAYLYPVFAVLLLGQFSELLPSLHQHEAVHYCIEIGGNYFEVAHDDDHRAEASTLPTARGLELDTDHHHDICALCQLVPSFLDTGVASWSLSASDAMGFSQESQFHAELFLAGCPARGPPVC